MQTIGVIFDLDGVLVDTAKYHFLAWKSLADHLGFEFTEAHNELLKGVSRVRSLEILLDIGKITLTEDEKQTYLTRKNDQYLEYIYAMTPKEILPGVAVLLKHLDDLNIPYALGSASKNAPLILKQVQLLERFTAIVDGNSVTKAKPDPEVFLIGAKKMGLSPEYCVVFEDAIAGVEAANAAGMLSIGMGDTHTLRAAHYNFNDLTELPHHFFTEIISEKIKDNEPRLYKTR